MALFQIYTLFLLKELRTDLTQTRQVNRESKQNEGVHIQKEKQKKSFLCSVASSHWSEMLVSVVFWHE